MPLVGNNIQKISAEKGEISPQISVNTNVELNDVFKRELKFAGISAPGLAFRFTFTADYAKAGKIMIEGLVLAKESEKKMDAIIADWNKNKKVSEDYTIAVLNRAMELGYTNSIMVANLMRLPVPMRMPKFEKKSAGKK